MKKIVLTGGGTAGHVTPNIALLPALREANYDIHYIGSFEGIESRLIPDFDVPYYGISTGKFRRYFDLKNFSDPFRVMKGYLDAKKILKEIIIEYFALCKRILSKLSSALSVVRCVFGVFRCLVRFWCI